MKKILIGLFLTICTIAGAQTTYYVSHHADSTYNDFSDVPTLNPGDSVLFQAGGVWREYVTIGTSGTAGNYIYIGRYGEGDNPKILGSDKATSFTEVETNIWRSGNTLTNSSTEYYPGRLYYMNNDSVSWGEYVGNNYLDISDTLQYAVDGSGYHYVYSVGNPETTYDSIEVNQRDRVFSLYNHNSYIEIVGIDVLFGRRGNIWAGYPAIAGATDLIIKDCHIAYCGSKSSGSAYLLAFWHSNVLIENCTFSDGGRRAISINTYTDAPVGGRKISNIIIRNNIFKRGYHTTAVDISAMNQAGDTIEGLYFHHNYINDSEIPAADIAAGHTANQIFIQEGDSATFLYKDMYFVANVFSKAQTRWMNCDANDGGADDLSIYATLYNNTFAGYNLNRTTSPYGGVALNGLDTLISRNNIFYDNFTDSDIESCNLHGYRYPVGFNIDYDLHFSTNVSANRDMLSYNNGTTGDNDFYNINEVAQMQSDHPELYPNNIVTSDPLFTDFDNFDYTLQSTSPAIGEGVTTDWIITTDNYGVTDTINKYDMNGRLFAYPTPSLGAYEYQDPDSSYCYYSSFTIPNQVSSTIDTLNRTISVVMPYGTDVTSLTPSTTVVNGTSSPTGAQNFTSSVNYTATALNGTSTYVYTVTVTTASPSTDTDILTFTIPNQLSTVINSTAHTVHVTMPYQSSVTALTPTITVSEGATIDPASGVQQDYTNSVEYTVTAQDGTTTQAWTVTVAASTSPQYQIYLYNGQPVSINGQFWIIEN